MGSSNCSAPVGARGKLADKVALFLGGGTPHSNLSVEHPTGVTEAHTAGNIQVNRHSYSTSTHMSVLASREDHRQSLKRPCAVCHTHFRKHCCVHGVFMSVQDSNWGCHIWVPDDDSVVYNTHGILLITVCL